MSKIGILDRLEFCKGVDITSTLDLRYESKRARRNATVHLLLVLLTAVVAVLNLLPSLQQSSVWAICSLVALLLLRSRAAVRASLLKASSIKESALQLQARLLDDNHGDQPFAYKISTFQPKMRLRVAVISKDSRICIRTYSVAPGEPASLQLEQRQAYTKRWLCKTFGEKWYQLAADRMISTPKGRTPQARFERFSVAKVE